jgi:hypothetical protein
MKKMQFLYEGKIIGIVDMKIDFINNDNDKKLKNNDKIINFEKKSNEIIDVDNDEFSIEKKMNSSEFKFLPIENKLDSNNENIKSSKTNNVKKRKDINLIDEKQKKEYNLLNEKSNMKNLVDESALKIKKLNDERYQLNLNVLYFLLEEQTTLLKSGYPPIISGYDFCNLSSCTNHTWEITREIREWLKIRYYPWWNFHTKRSINNKFIWENSWSKEGRIIEWIKYYSRNEEILPFNYPKLTRYKKESLKPLKKINETIDINDIIKNNVKKDDKTIKLNVSGNNISRSSKIIECSYGMENIIKLNRNLYFSIPIGEYSQNTFYLWISEMLYEWKDREVSERFIVCKSFIEKSFVCIPPNIYEFSELCSLILYRSLKNEIEKRKRKLKTNSILSKFWKMLFSLPYILCQKEKTYIPFLLPFLIRIGREKDFELYNMFNHLLPIIQIGLGFLFSKGFMNSSKVTPIIQNLDKSIKIQKSGKWDEMIIFYDKEPLTGLDPISGKWGLLPTNTLNRIDDIKKLSENYIFGYQTINQRFENEKNMEFSINEIINNNLKTSFWIGYLLNPELRKSDIIFENLDEQHYILNLENDSNIKSLLFMSLLISPNSWDLQWKDIILKRFQLNNMNFINEFFHYNCLKYVHIKEDNYNLYSEEIWRRIFLFTIKDYKDTRESFYNELKSIKDYFYNLDSNLYNDNFVIDFDGNIEMIQNETKSKNMILIKSYKMFLNWCKTLGKTPVSNNKWNFWNFPDSNSFEIPDNLDSFEILNRSYSPNEEFDHFRLFFPEYSFQESCFLFKFFSFNNETQLINISIIQNWIRYSKNRNSKLKKFNFTLHFLLRNHYNTSFNILPNSRLIDLSIYYSFLSFFKDENLDIELISFKDIEPYLPSRIESPIPHYHENDYVCGYCNDKAIILNPDDKVYAAFFLIRILSSREDTKKCFRIEKIYSLEHWNYNNSQLSFYYLSRYNEELFCKSLIKYGNIWLNFENFKSICKYFRREIDWVGFFAKIIESIHNVGYSNLSYKNIHSLSNSMDRYMELGLHHYSIFPSKLKSNFKLFSLYFQTFGLRIKLVKNALLKWKSENYSNITSYILYDIINYANPQINTHYRILLMIWHTRAESFLSDKTLFIRSHAKKKIDNYRKYLPASKMKKINDFQLKHLLKTIHISKTTNL